MSVMCLRLVLSGEHDNRKYDRCHVYMTYYERMRHVATARAKRKARRGTPLTRPHDKDSTYRRRHAHDRYAVHMSSVHDNPVKLQVFHQVIKETVKELEADPIKRWTRTSIAGAGGLSRNQLYAWMGQGPQKLKQLPPRERVERFYQGVKKPWPPTFKRLGWEAMGQGADTSPEPTAKPSSGPASEIDRRIRLLQLASERPGIKPEERRELDRQLMQARRAKNLQAMADELMAELERELETE